MDSYDNHYKKLLVTSASLLVTSALLVVTRSYYIYILFLQQTIMSECFGASFPGAERASNGVEPGTLDNCPILCG